MIRWKNKLEIADAQLQVMEVSRTQLNGSVLREKELVVSYKTIYINLFSAIVLDMKTGMIKFRYESYQLWESPVTGFLNS